MLNENMKRKLKRYFVVKEYTLKTSINVLFGFTFEEANRFLKKYKKESISEEYRGSLGLALHEEDDDGVFYYTIWIPSPKWSLVQQAIIGHELTHICFWVCKNKGIDIIADSPNETYAYLWEYFFLGLCRKIAKYLEVKRPKPRASTKSRKKINRLNV